MATLSHSNFHLFLWHIVYGIWHQAYGDPGTPSPGIWQPLLLFKLPLNMQSNFIKVNIWQALFSLKSVLQTFLCWHTLCVANFCPGQFNHTHTEPQRLLRTKGKTQQFCTRWGHMVNLNRIDMWHDGSETHCAECVHLAVLIARGRKQSYILALWVVSI